jgi:hypothetical protein
MIRNIVGVVAGAATWLLIATAGNVVLRLVLPGYAAVEKAMDFTASMMLARLALGALASLGAGFVAAWVSRRSARGVWALAGILLLFFIPVHYQLWDRFPPWYHAAFLVSLVVLTVLGGRLYRSPAHPMDQPSAFASGRRAARP